MEYQKENMSILKTVSKTAQTKNYEWDIIVPDSKPDIATIISTDGVVNITGKEIMQDRVVINGNVKITILYISSDDSKSIKSIENIQNFNCVLELKDLRQNMELNIYAFVNKISSNMLNSRKINVESVIDFHGIAYDNEEISYIEKMEEENVEYKSKEIKTERMASYFENSFSFNENIEVPVGKSSITEILKIKPEFLVKDIKFANNKIVLRGNILFSTVYLSDTDDDPVQFMTNEIPINEIIDWKDINEDSIFDYDVFVSNFNYILRDNSDGEKRIIKVCGDILIKGKTYEELLICPIVDAYSLKSNLNLQKNLFNYEEIHHRLSGQFSLKETVSFNSLKDIQKVLLLEIKEDVDSVTITSGVIKIKGNIAVSMLYISTDGEVCMAKSLVPLEYNVNTDVDSSEALCDLKLQIDSFSYNIVSSDEIDLRINLSYKIIIKNHISQEIVQDIECDKTNCNYEKHGITVFFCDGNENLWDIAKKYKTTVKDIALANELDDNIVVKKGMKLLIP